MIDLQSERNINYVPINQVGIKGIKLPVQIIVGNNFDNNYHNDLKNYSGNQPHHSDRQAQATIATFDIATEVPSTHRATHMSRFVEILQQQAWVLSIPALAEMLELVTQKLATTTAIIKAEFTIFRQKLAPISKTSGLVDYEIIMQASKNKQDCKFLITAKIPVTSVCPCSKAISEAGAHNQRTLITVTVTTTAENFALAKLITTVEQQASCELYSILKRSDEKYVTEHGYHNAKFVEDIVRDVASALSKDPAILTYRIHVESYESIHNHSAYAMLDSTNR